MVNYPVPCFLNTYKGEMPEWLNGTVSKTVVGFGPPRVRIPPSPLKSLTKRSGFFFPMSHH